MHDHHHHQSDNQSPSPSSSPSSPSSPIIIIIITCDSSPWPVMIIQNIVAVLSPRCWLHKSPEKIFLHQNLFQPCGPQWTALGAVLPQTEHSSDLWDSGDDDDGDDDDDDEAASLDWPNGGAPGSPPDVLLARGPARHPPPLRLSLTSRPLQEGSVCGEEWGGWRPGPLLSPLPSRLVSAGPPGGEAQVWPGSPQTSPTICHSRRLWRDVGQLTRLDRVGQVFWICSWGRLDQNFVR